LRGGACSGGRPCRTADLVSTLVASAQIRIHHANTLDNAKARLQATKARIMLTDVTFERGCCEDGMRMMARLPFRTALVLVSPLADLRLWIDALEAGAYDLVLEPFHADELRWILGGIVLTKPGLVGIVTAVKEGRVTFQRILTYTLNSVIKKVVQVLFLAVGLVMTGHAILTPMLMVTLMITGDSRSIFSGQPSGVSMSD